MLHMIVVVLNVLFMFYMAIMTVRLIIQDIMFNNEKLYLWLHIKFTKQENAVAKLEKIKQKMANKQKQDLKQR